MDKNKSFEYFIEHFIMKKNVPFERSVFYNVQQQSAESIEQQVTRLKQLGKYCEYDIKIKSNIHPDQITSSFKIEKEIPFQPIASKTQLMRTKTLSTSNNGSSENDIIISRKGNKPETHSIKRTSNREGNC